VTRLVRMEGSVLDQQIHASAKPVSQGYVVKIKVRIVPK